ncbi:DUF4234 domain-containing protein [Brachyspira hyodysenteriae]
MLVLLNAVTCGIYYLCRIYKTTDQIKNFNNSKRRYKSFFRTYTCFSNL